MKLKQMNKEYEEEEKIYIKPHYKLARFKNKKGEIEIVRVLCDGFWRKRSNFHKKEKNAK